MPNRIDLTPIDELVQVHEALVAPQLADITPGDLLEWTSAAVETVQLSTISVPLFPIAFALQGANGGSGGIDDDYAPGETCRLVIPRAGDEIYAWLENGESVTRFVGFLITNAGNGTLKEAAGTETGRDLIAQALETVTASGKTRIKVRIL